LYFWNGDDPGRFTGDFRTPGLEGYYFDFTVNSNFSGQTIIDFFPENLPQNFEWIVISPTLNVRYYDKKLITQKNESHYRLIIGTKDFLTPMLDSYPAVPKQFKLSQNYPNPFNPTTKIQYQLPEATNVSIEIFDIMGRNVRTIMHEEYKEPGYHEITWNGTDNFQRKVASGIYIFYLRSELYKKAIKMVLQK